MLPYDEQVILWIMACLFGSSVDEDEVVRLSRRLVSGNVPTLFRHLVSKGLIIKSSRYYYSDEYKLAPGLLLPVLKSMVDKGRVEEVVKVVGRHKSTGATQDMAMAVTLLSHKASKDVSFTRCTSRFEDELTAVLTDHDYEQIFNAVPDSTLSNVIIKTLRDVLLSDSIVDWAYLRRLVVDSRTDHSGSAEAGEMWSIFNYLYYLATGSMCVTLERLPVNSHSLCTAAVQKLYGRDYVQAYKLFTRAMTVNNKFSPEKGIFVFPITTYLYAMTLLLAGTETSLKKLVALVKKHSIQDFFVLAQLFTPLYSYFVGHEQPVVSKSRLKSQSYRESPQVALRWLTWMVLNRLGLWPADIWTPSLTWHQPQAAWLRNELLPTGVVPEKDDAASAFGGSLFYRLQVKPMWELRLEEIINGNSSGEADEDQRPVRLIYLLEYGNIVPIEQKRLKSGAWSVGRRLGLTQFLDYDATYLDATDRRLQKDLNHWDYDIFVNSNIDSLCGCDHVFTGTQSDLIPVRVHEEKPFLIINKDKDGSFSVSTNVDSTKLINNTVTIISKNSETDYAVYSLSPFERKAYRQILAQGKYPAEAEPLLMKLISTIGGRTEIHSNMVVDLDDLKRVEGNARLTLRCQPDRSAAFRVGVLVHALPSLSFVPGKGNVTTIAEHEGQKVQVVRSMRKERANLRLFCQELVNLEVIDSETDFAPDSLTDTISMGLGSFLELIEWARENKDSVDLEWPEGTRVKYHPSVSAKSANIGFKQKNGWFEVEGDVQIDEGQVLSLQNLLDLMHQSGRSRYIQVGDHEYITLSTDLSRILRRIDTVTTERRSHLQMASAAAGLIGDVLDDTDATVHHSKALDAIRKRIEDSSKLEPHVPANLQATLRDYQVEGYEWLWRVTSWGAGACLADDMGLGKTLQTIALLLDRETDGPSLVVAPASVVPNWRNELQRFAPSLSVTILNDAADRSEAITSAEAGSVVVSTYAMLGIQQEALAGREWNVVCLDEAHTIKNPNTKMSRAAMTLQAKRKVILTGTPIQNHLSELWNLFQFINPGLLGSSEQFARKFIEPIEAKHDKERQNQLRRLISPFLLRRTKAEVIEELPEKNEITVPVELSSDEMTMYEVGRRHAEQSVMADKSVKMSTLAEITRLRQMACSCSLVDKRWKRPSSKVLAFIDLAESLNDSGHRALVFSQFTSFFDEVRRAMDKAHLPYLYLDGSTPMGQREKLVAEFQSGSCPFFLISLKAGGLGLNLTGANYVIHLDPWWNPAIEQQATDRAYRIGQKQDVTVYHLISQHTIEEKIQRLHKTKRDLADSLLQGTDMSHALTQEELLELLK